MALFWYKFGMLFGILASSVAMGFLPLMLKKVSPTTKTRLLSFGNCFAGGVFLSIGFVHLLSESAELMSVAVHVHYPLAYLLSVVGFVVVFFIEKVVFAQNHGHAPYSKVVEETPATVTQHEKYGSLDVEKDQHHHHHGHEHQNAVFAVILTLVLSIHSIISGIALGMEGTLQTLVPLFVGIIGHKWIEAFALGVAINKASESLAKTAKLVIIYSSSEPLGIFIGQILSIFLPTQALQITQAFVLSVASGTFIYVAVMDILPAEFGHHAATDKYPKFGLFGVGIAAASCLLLIFSSEHAYE